MSLSDLFKINEFKETIGNLTEENTTLKETIGNLTKENSTLRNQVTDLQDFIHIRLPLLDTESLSSVNTIDDFKYLWAKHLRYTNHDDYYQQLRQNRACRAYLTPLDINYQTGVARFRGEEETYETTLISCQCMDFQRHFHVCKHMYRLAYELGIFTLNKPVESVPCPSKLFRKSDLVSRKRLLSASSQDILYKLTYLPNIVVQRVDADQLLRNNLAIIDSSKYELLNTFKKYELLSLLPDNIHGIKSAKKTILIEKIIAEYPDVISEIEKKTVSIKLSPYASRLQDSFHYM